MLNSILTKHSRVEKLHQTVISCLHDITFSQGYFIKKAIVVHVFFIVSVNNSRKINIQLVNFRNTQLC